MLKKKITRNSSALSELHKPIFVVKPVSGESKLLLTCSTTGRPAPELFWDIEDTALQHSATYYTNNQNGTMTVNKTATAHVTSTHFAKTTQIKCAALNQYGKRNENSVTITNGETTVDLLNQYLMFHMVYNVTLFFLKDEMLSIKARADIRFVVPGKHSHTRYLMLNDNYVFITYVFHMVFILGHISPQVS